MLTARGAMRKNSELPTPEEIELHDDPEDREAFGFLGEEMAPAWRDALMLIALFHRKPSVNPHLLSAQSRDGYDARIFDCRSMLSGCEISLMRPYDPTDSAASASGLCDSLILKAGELCSRAGFTEHQSTAMAAEAISQLTIQRLAGMERGSSEALSVAYAPPSRAANHPALFPLAAELIFGELGTAYATQAMHSRVHPIRPHRGFRIDLPELQSLSESRELDDSSRAGPPPLARYALRIFTSLTHRGLGSEQASHLGARETAIALAMCRMCDAIQEAFWAHQRRRPGRARAREIFVDPLISALEARAIELDIGSATGSGSAQGSGRRSL